jgi:hypothetical protein
MPDHPTLKKMLSVLLRSRPIVGLLKATARSPHMEE